MFGTFFQQLYNTVDAIVVGRFVGSDIYDYDDDRSVRISSVVVNLCRTNESKHGVNFLELSDIMGFNSSLFYCVL